MSSQKTINLFIIGPGNIGSNFLNYIEKQSRHMFSEMSIRLKLVGIGDTQKMLFAEEGIPLKDWEKTIGSSGIKMNIKTIMKRIICSACFPRLLFCNCVMPITTSYKR